MNDINNASVVVNIVFKVLFNLLPKIVEACAHRKCQCYYPELVMSDIELVGLCTDICVVSNAIILKAMFPEVNITVDASCCAGVTPESHKAALLTMKMCQIEVTNMED